VQRALDWDGSGDRRQRARNLFAACPQCGAALELGLPDPKGLGRSMQRCSDPECDGHEVHVMTRADYQELT
jgi:hypothetical protein